MDFEADRPGFFGPRFFLSNFYQKHAPLFGLYHSNEAFYMAMKTMDLEQRAQFTGLIDPRDAKRMGRALALRPDWELIKDDVMRAGIAEKFPCESVLAQHLLATGSEYLEETNSWHDNYWGNCTCVRAQCRTDGLNRLGMLLMERRGILRTVYEASCPT